MRTPRPRIPPRLQQDRNVSSPPGGSLLRPCHLHHRPTIQPARRDHQRRINRHRRDPLTSLLHGSSTHSVGCLRAPRIPVHYDRIPITTPPVTFLLEHNIRLHPTLVQQQLPPIQRPLDLPHLEPIPLLAHPALRNHHRLPPPYLPTGWSGSRERPATAVYGAAKDEPRSGIRYLRQRPLSSRSGYSALLRSGNPRIPDIHWRYASALAISRRGRNRVQGAPDAAVGD